ncbi:lipase chaperone [Leptospira fletcheri]|uniref:Lipase helper protein n=1 Tax=Leptospira fletcheri TaxID=2484981 RepID=A0A4R9GC48_9LEPT|nr:lipase secretion chaperone [Leptospira fletcheri]TGK08577.1 lipase chaperone [Leptospira fletcheri]
MLERLKQIPPKIRLILVGVFLIMLVIFIVWEPSSKRGSHGSNAEDSDGFTVSRNESGELILNPEVMDTSRSIYKDGEWLSYDDIMKFAANGELDLVSELWALRRRCPTGYTIDQCNEVVKAFLLDHYPGVAGEKLMAMFRKYLTYEQVLRSYELPRDIKQDEAYELIKKKRREVFSDQEAKLIFGLEESERQYQFGLSDFMSETKNLPGDKRLNRYEDYRKAVYGNYYDAVVKREPKFNKYETELFLRENDMNKLSAVQKDPQLRSIREKYFGKDGADRIEKVYKDIEVQKNKETEIDREEQAWLRANPTAKSADRDKAISAIRTKILGSQEAEEYGRRKAYEAEQKRLNSK